MLDNCDISFTRRNILCAFFPKDVNDVKQVVKARDARKKTQKANSDWNF